MSIFFIRSNAFMTLSDFPGSGSVIISPMTAGTICQETPYLSLSQPHSCISPPSESFSHSLFTSFCVWQFTTNDMAGGEGKTRRPPRRPQSPTPRALSPLLRRQARDLHDRPDFDGAFARARYPPGDGDRLVEVYRVDQEVAAQLLAGFREGAVGDHPLAVTHPDAGRRRHRRQGIGGQILAVRLELVRELRRLLVAVLPLGIGPCLLVRVDQQHVFHRSPSILTSFGGGGDRHRIVSNRRSSRVPCFGGRGGVQASTRGLKTPLTTR